MAQETEMIAAGREYQSDMSPEDAATFREFASALEIGAWERRREICQFYVTAERGLSSEKCNSSSAGTIKGEMTETTFNIVVMSKPRFLLWAL
jgi:hypothetical protein